MANPTARTPRTPRTPNPATTGSSANTAPNAPKATNGKTLQVELTSINPDTSFYTRPSKGNTEMERQTGSGYCAQIDADVIVTRSLWSDDGEEKPSLEEHHIGKTFSAIVTKVLSKDGSGYVFFAEISLSRGNATEESVNLYDAI
jgi:hypothetical protein